jgi:hypothetical protein
MDWREATISAGVGPGWEPLVDELHAKVLEIEPEIVVDQVKEKFGGLRYYVAGAPIRLDKVTQINALVKEYEGRSFMVCEWCGASEGVETSSGTSQRWLKSLCPAHREAWDREERWWL